MFDRLTVQTGHDQHHYHKTDIHEHRAPTDDSVKLLKEMEGAALDKLLGSVKLENCPVSGVIHMMRDQLNLSHKYIIEYKIGAKTDGNVTIDHEYAASQHETIEKTVIKLRDELAKSIANNVLSGCFDDAAKRLHRGL